MAFTLVVKNNDDSSFFESYETVEKALDAAKEYIAANLEEVWRIHIEADVQEMLKRVREGKIEYP